MMTTVISSQEVNKKDLAVRIGVGVALSAMTTVMLITAFPPTNIWPFAFFCLVPMLVAQHRILPLKWSWLAPAIGGTLWVLWLVIMLFGIKAETSFILLIPAIALLKDYFTTKSNRLFHERTKYRYFVLEGIFGWVGFEMIRSFIPLVRMHGFIGHTVHTQPWLIQPVSIFSIYGLDLLIILVDYALAQGAFALIDRKWQWGDVPAVSKRLVNGWLVGMGGALAVWVAISLVILAGAPKDPEVVRVAAVQNGVPIPAHWPPDQPQEERLANLVEQTRAAAQQGAQLVVWPELGVGFDPQVEHTEELRALATETGATLVIGYGLATKTESRNAAVPLMPSGEFLPIYGKSHIPPGEALDPDAGKYPVYDTALGKWGTIICHDTNFTESGRIMARKGARLLAIPTFEAYIPGFEKIFYIQMVFRSVENRIATVKADTAFSSSIIDPYGRILELRSGAPDGEAFALVADVPLGSANTLYTRVGDWMGWLSLAGFIVFMILPDVIKKRQEKERRAAMSGLTEDQVDAES
jgi:apolipoprotein N-acyltransferase